MFPLYVWMVTGLLLIALIFFVFAQAAVTRGGGQSAADAAALAAAHESRDQLYLDFLEAAQENDDVDEILDGAGFETEGACEAAGELAVQNKGSVIGCAPEDARVGYRVEVETDDAVDSTVLPGADGATARVAALAVIDSRCSVESADEDRVRLDCEGDDWEFDPGDDDEVPEARDLFRVYLED